MATEKQELNPLVSRQSWLDERLDWARFKEKYLRKPFPVHSSFFLGEIALFSFIVLVLTGIFLALSYVPSTELVKLDGKDMPAAYASVVQNDHTPFGLIVRQVHHWAAHLMIVAILLHLLRIFFTGLYKKPRELNWVVGVLLLGLTVFAAFSGYLLPFDQFAVTATGIGYNIARSVPWVGPALANFIFAGKFPSTATIPRFYAYHVMLLPLILIILVGLHLLIMFKQKHSQPPYALRRAGVGKILGVPLWPHQTLLMAVLFLVLSGSLFIVAGLFPVHPVEYYGPPGPATPIVKPDWYLLWPYGALKLIPGWINFQFLGATINSENVGGVVIPGLILLLLLLIPFLDRSRESVHYLELPREHAARTAFGMAVLVFFGVLMVAGYNEELGLSVGALQFTALLAPLVTGLFTYVLLAALRRSRESVRDGPEIVTSVGANLDPVKDSEDLRR
ncbi:cytochrome bc complex cytochrome b subunit [Candidatus Acetothermia bacterium]|nr:cytochrome bc complex cytochrome b subunit [Candidatus Acetothermia bacterium]MBI3459740.1 cytochrome bc complex cytochrome b subunit [Candidatus Acetothermia bacterium]